MPPFNGNDGFTIGKAQVLGKYLVEEGYAAAGGTLSLALVPGRHFNGATNPEGGHTENRQIGIGPRSVINQDIALRIRRKGYDRCGSLHPEICVDDGDILTT